MTSCKVAKTMLHHWEEPPISGTRGSGAVFFAGCNLRCVFCQNYEISQQGSWPETTAQQLAEIFWSLAEQGAHNINLITPTLHTAAIAEAIKITKRQGFQLPFIYNSSAYESINTLQKMDGLIDVYLPDLKYFDEEAAWKYSRAKDYFSVASRAIAEMHRQVGECQFSDDGLLQRGLVVRHLVLPGCRKDSMKLLDWLSEALPDGYISLMAQYVPTNRAAEFSELNRRLTTLEYRSVVEHAVKRGLTRGWTQSLNSAVTEFIPDFMREEG